MRFCFLTTFFPPLHFGGDAVFVAHLANALAGQGHHVEVIHCADSFELLRNDVPASPMPLHPAIIVHTLRSPWGALSPLLTYMTGGPGLKSPQLRKILSAGFDVVHWHNVSLVGGPGALSYGRGVRLCTLHDYWFICPTHILFKFNREACTERACLRCTLAHARPPQPWRAGGSMRAAIRHIDRFLAPSEFVRQQFRNSPLGIDATVLPHFIPASAEGTSPERREHYLYVGRLEKAKGLQTIIPLFRDTRRPLVIAGAGDFEAGLRSLAQGAGHIRFLGRVPHAELAQLYAAARATIVPSICFETFGLIALESLQRGTPAIVSAYGALPEVVAGNPGGFVYHDLRELESILDRFDSDPLAARRAGEEGRSALERYSVEAHLKRYFQIIEEARAGRSLYSGARQADVESHA
jgi:glycosyltransferase involved in cell wall biosynthesis